MRLALIAAGLLVLPMAQGCTGATHVADSYAYGAGALNLDPWATRPRPSRSPVAEPAPVTHAAPVKAPQHAEPQPQVRAQPVPVQKEHAHLETARAEPTQREPVRSEPPPRVVAAPIAESPRPPPEPTKPAIDPPREQQPLVGSTRTEADLRGIQRVESASALLGTPGLQDRAFVAHVLRAAGQDLEVDRNRPYAPALYELLQKRGLLVSAGVALPGDLIFFKNTADLNSNGRPDDGVTLVGVVERIDGSRIVLIAQRAGKVRRLAVDASRPELVRDARGEVVNTRLVRWPGSEGPLTAGQCLSGFARP